MINKYKNPAERIALARQIASEGIILLKNEDSMLPFGEEKVAVFGRPQVNTIKCGTGSAFCESEYCVSILEGLCNAGINVDSKLSERYVKWCAENSVKGFGVWGTGSHINPEMLLSEEDVRDVATRTKKAVFVIGRTAGENDDSSPVDGDFRLSSEEKAAYELVCKHFSNIILVINSGNLIDMRFTQREEVKAVVLLNLPGMEGGNALGDVLSGKFTPSGKLTDTVAYDYSDYPSSKYFGKKGGIIQNYTDDIFVGYRYFETFEHAKDKVMYPFGYGLSYTQFESRAISFTCDDTLDGMVKAEIAVKNIGDTYSGKEVIMLYSSAPKSKLGAPAYELRAFQKTKLLAPGEEEILTLSFPIKDMASFDDTGVLGTANAWVLMHGAYSVYFGNNIKKIQKIGDYEVAADTVLKTCTALPTELTSRLTATGEMETLDFIPEDPAKGIMIDAIEENVIDTCYAQDETTVTYRLNVPAPGVYRAYFSGADAENMTYTLNGRPLDNLQSCFTEKGDDIILIIGMNELVFTYADGKTPSPITIKLTKNNEPTVIKAEGTSYIQGGKYSECGLWVYNAPYTDSDGAIKKGRALTRMHEPGRNAMYKLEVEKAGVYDVRLRYCNIHAERDLSEMFTFLISNVGQEVEPVKLEQTCTDDRYTLKDQRFVTSAPFSLALPKGEA